MIDERHIKAKWAALVERGLLPCQIAKLTDRQIHELYFHPRDKEGNLILPAAPLPEAAPVAQTLESALNDLASIQTMMSPSDYEGAIRLLKETYANHDSVSETGADSGAVPLE